MQSPRPRSAVLCLVLLSAIHVRAATTVALTPDQDSVVATGIANAFVSNNYGGAGATSVSGSSAGKGEAQTITRFDTATAKASFDTEFGAGNWILDSASLRLVGMTPGGANPLFNSTNVAGQFLVQWVPTDNWVEGTGTPNTPATTGVTWTDIATLGTGAESLGAQSYDGTIAAADYYLSPSPGLLLDISNGKTASFILSAVSPTMTAIFVSRSNGTPANWPELNLTASAVPEPGRAMLVMVGALSLVFRRRGNNEDRIS